MTQTRKFDLYGEDVNIDRVVTVLRELSADIHMNGAAKTLGPQQFVLKYQ